ncbi:TonB-dependent receptor [Pollutimonas harenae]|uniref:TonB-dependent siderophore receptor n=1 Tax=Pollutimonas harenae TaxID=657015 RepID=A0A853H4G3_9BURK|nr:TonB-dependent siderophore receptor [Pollutimonas harenae]NYT85453.1 TonB-dependent siderophore receptor [Pollutimonas harenae]TEA70547.1 TonB-dependent siderophore receptor [Pollutimonas harenae]
MSIKNLPPSAILGSSLALTLVSSSVFMPLAHAQNTSEGATQLSPVTVTGTRPDTYQTQEASQTKFTAPLLDTPKTVQIVPQAVIEDTAATSLEDVLRNVPGITFGAGEGGQPLADRPFIRGASSGSNIYVDGIRDAGGQTREIFNLESVEVIKGADSVYGGRGTGGGSINMNSKHAHLGNAASANLGVGTDKYLRATIDGNWQLSDTSAFRLNILGAKGDMAGRDSVDYKNFGIAPTISFGLGTPTRASISFYHYQTDGMPDYGVPLTRGTTIETSTGILDVGRDTFYGLYARDFRKTKADIGTIELEHDLTDKLTVRNVTRYGETLNDYLVTNPGDGKRWLDGPTNTWWLQRGDKSRWQKTTMLANVTELNGELETGSLKHRFNVGLELSSERTRNAGYSQTITNGSACPASLPASATNSLNCTPLYNPNPNDPWSGSIDRNELNLDAKSITQAAYLFDSIEVSEKFLVNAGIRLDRYKVYGMNGDEYSKGSWNMFNYQLGLVYKPAPNGSIYLSYATASTPPNMSGGDQDSLSTGRGNPTKIGELEPEKSRTIELGTKWDVLNERLSLTAALFNTERRDAQIEVDDGIYEQAGKTRVRGLELGIGGQITPEWMVYGGYTYMDSELVQGAYDGVNEGDPLANTPKHSFSLWSTYKMTPALTIGGGAYYVGKTYGGNQGGAGGGTNEVYMPAYWRFDAMASYQVNKNLGLQLNVLNLTDKEYYSHTNGVHHADFGPGRQVILSANLRY